MVKREHEEVLGGAQFRSLFSDGRASQALWTLMVMRVIYALNWFNIGGIFSNMALDFHEGTLGLGALTGSEGVVPELPPGLNHLQQLLLLLAVRVQTESER